MPLLGHFFSALAVTSAASASRGNRVGRAPRSLLWLLTPLSVLCFFLPDVAAQASLATGFNAGYRLSHTLWAAVTLAAAAGLAIRSLGASPRYALTVPLAGTLSHVLLDALQSENHLLLWPLSARPLLSSPILPSGVPGEAIVLTLSIVAWLVLRRRRRSDRPAGAALMTPEPRLGGMLSAALVGSIAVSAVTVFVLREQREHQLHRARVLVEAGQVTQGFALLESADRWPSTAKPGRVDYVRGVGHLKRGERALAEWYLLRAFRADPHFVWTLYDLAVLYAEEPRALEERRMLAAPYLRSLATDFPGDQEAKRLFDKARQRLGF